MLHMIFCRLITSIEWGGQSQTAAELQSTAQEAEEDLITENSKGLLFRWICLICLVDKQHQK